MSFQKKNRQLLSFQPVFSRVVVQRRIAITILWLLVPPMLLASCQNEAKQADVLPLVGAAAPELPASVSWINTDVPLSLAELRGDVVLLYFWSSTSINSLRAIRFINQWHRKYGESGLQIVGVHTPQFDFEKDATQVKDAVSKEVMFHPVVLDNDFLIWTAYRNRAWPAFYLIDHRGIIRDIFVGEMDYDQIEFRIQDLLSEIGIQASDSIETLEPQVDFSRIGTPQINAGYSELSHFGSPEPVMPNATQNYSADKTLQFNHFYLVGEWEIQKDKALIRGRGGKLLLRYEASRVYVVLGSLHASRLRAEVRLDGEPLTTENYGKDIWFRDGRSYVEIDNRRIYELVDTHGIYGEYTLEISFSSGDIEVYVMMFG